MSYIYETHLHTNAASRCGVSNPQDYIKPYIDKGYTGIIVTDHFLNGNTCIDKDMPWRDQVNAFCRGYEQCREEGDKHGLDVFFGFEARLGNDECLVYGLDKSFLYDHPELVTCNHQELFRIVHNGGGAIVQAHPYRERDYMTAVEIYPNLVDAFEGFNRENSLGENRRAVELAEKYCKIITAGSDVHNVRRIDEAGPFGVISETRWSSIKDYVRMLRGGKQFDLHLNNEGNLEEDFTLDMDIYIHDEMPD